MDTRTEIALERGFFGDLERTVLRRGTLQASLFRYATGVEAIRLSNPRGHLVVLPYMGQMAWRACFDGVELAMRSMFHEPRPASTIIETYGCLAYHAGLLRNGTPGPDDTHPLHGEMPCMPMDHAGLELGVDDRGGFIAVTGRRDYAMGFGSHYLATPRIVLREDASIFEMTMTAENLSAAPMDLMYICHANFAFPEGARIVQSVPFDPAHVVTRTAVPGHVVPTERYRTLLRDLAADPSGAEVLDDPSRFAPEQVFYVRGLVPGPDGLAHVLLRRPEGDAFTVAYDPVAMPHTIRWILSDADHGVAGFAMPGTCEPEGYTAEKRKGHVRVLAGGARATFTTYLGYADGAAAAELARSIATPPSGA